MTAPVSGSCERGGYPGRWSGGGRFPIRRLIGFRRESLGECGGGLGACRTWRRGREGPGVDALGGGD